MKKIGLLALIFIGIVSTNLLPEKMETLKEYHSILDLKIKFKIIMQNNKNLDTCVTYFSGYVELHKQFVALHKTDTTRFYQIPPYALCDNQAFEYFNAIVNDVFGEKVIDLTPYFIQMRDCEYDSTCSNCTKSGIPFRFING